MTSASYQSSSGASITAIDSTAQQSGIRRAASSLASPLIGRKLPGSRHLHEPDAALRRSQGDDSGKSVRAGNHAVPANKQDRSETFTRPRSLVVAKALRRAKEALVRSQMRSQADEPVQQLLPLHSNPKPRLVEEVNFSKIQFSQVLDP